MARRFFLLPCFQIFLAAVIIAIFSPGISSATTTVPTSIGNTRTFTVGYSDVYTEYGIYGRVYVRHYDNGYDTYEVCSGRFSYNDAEALCQAMGYMYEHLATVSATSNFKTVDLNCNSFNIRNCNIETRPYCAYTIYIYCSENSTTTEMATTTETSMTTGTREQTSTVENLIPGYSSISFTHGYYGHVFVGNSRYEVCYNNRYNNRVGEALCGWYGYSYKTYLSPTPLNGYRTVDVQCSSSSIYSCSFLKRGYCSTALYLFCFEITTEPETTSVVSTTIEYTAARLIGSGYIGRGTIEIYHNGQWGTICDDSFDKPDGDVICRMLGYNFSRNVYANAHYGIGSGPIWLDDLECRGRENDIGECRSGGWGNHNCGHYEDAGVLCGYTGVRLIGSGYSDRGTIEVLHNGEWGTLCDDLFDKADGDVICRMLGFNASKNIFSSAHYGQGSGPISQVVNCNGYETDIAECGLSDWGTTACSHYEDAGVYCGDGNDNETTNMTYDSCNSFVCYNGGTCITNYNGYPGYYCRCPNGFIGSNCQNYATTYDACYPNPCRNGATCSRDYYYSRSYYCLCPRGYSGQNCDNYVGYYETTSYDPCYSHNPCKNGGTCYYNHGYPGYYCACPNGYSGRSCDTYNGFSIESAIAVHCHENNWNVAVYLPPLYSRYPDFNPGDLYLGQDSCTGYVDGNFLRFRSDYTTCSTETRTSSDNIVYTNEIIYAVHDTNHHFIVREYRFRVPVDCFLSRSEESTGHYYHGHITIPQAHHVTGSTHHSVHLRFYTDSSFQHPKSLYGSKVGDTVYVKAFTDVRDYNLKMRLSDCYTTPTSSPYSSLKYFIMQNGCVIDPNAGILSQNTHETRFYFQDFEYSTNQNSLYLHCNATFCKSNDYSAACEQTCHHKRLGGGDVVFDGPVESFDVNDAVRLTSATSGTAGKGSRNYSENSTLLVVISLVFGVVILAMTIAIIVGKLKKRIRQRGTQVVKDI